MGLQELFTELKKLYPLPSYDVAKLGYTRSFRGICMEKYRKNNEKNQKKLSKKCYNFPPVGPNMVIFGQVIGKKETKNL